MSDRNAPIYRGMDRPTLDAAYNNQAAAKDLPAMRAGWVSRSEKLRGEHGQHLDLAYGAAPAQRLDLYLADEPNTATLVFIHGGYWQYNRKEDFAFIAGGPLARGVNVACIGYTLTPQARMDDIVAEVRSAVDWIAAHLPEFGADPRRIFASGHSAGGHLAATLASHPAVQGGIPISGLYDLEPIRLCYLNEKIGLDVEEARRNSPLHHLPPRACPLLVAYGTSELPELCRQSEEFAEAGKAAGLPFDLVPVAGADHFTILEELARPDGRLTEELLKAVSRAE